MLHSWCQWDARIGFRERTCHVASELLFTVYLNPCGDTRYHSARESQCASFSSVTWFSSPPAFVGFLCSPTCILTQQLLTVPSCALHVHCCRSKCCCCRQPWRWGITGCRAYVVLSHIVLYRAQHWLCRLWGWCHRTTEQGGRGAVRREGRSCCCS